MPVEIGPEWDPAAHDYGERPYTEEGKKAAIVMGATWLAALAAMSGVIWALGGTIGAGVVTVETTQVLTTEQLMSIYGLHEGEALIYASALRKGWTAAQAAKFVADLAVKRFLQSGQISTVAAVLAQQELEAVQQRAGQIQSVVDAAIIEAQARVNEQAALSLFFTSGL